MNPKDSPTASERAEGPADERIDGVLKTIADGFSLHGYRQGTKECVAFHRGIEYARSRLAAATPVVPPSKSAMIAICAALGFDPTNHHNAAKCPYCRPSLAASPSPRTPEQPEQRPDSDHPVGE